MDLCISLRNMLRNPLGKSKVKVKLNKIKYDDRNRAYVKQTKCAIGTKFKEDIATYRYGILESPSITQHMNDTIHNINIRMIL